MTTNTTIIVPSPTLHSNIIASVAFAVTVSSSIHFSYHTTPNDEYLKKNKKKTKQTLQKKNINSNNKNDDICVKTHNEKIKQTQKKQS